MLSELFVEINSEKLCAILLYEMSSLDCALENSTASTIRPTSSSILFNGFSLDVGQAASAAPPALGDVSAGVLAAWEPVALIGSFGLVPAGLARGLFFAVRIVLLVVASLAVTYTTTSTELTDALGFFLRPLKRLGVPTDDIAMVSSLALRFIPVTAEEFSSAAMSTQ